MGRYIYYQCDEDDYGYTLAKEFLKLLPVTDDLDESDLICSELFDQINDSNNKLLLDDRNKENAKDALKRIISLNSEEHFIDNLTKLIASSMNLGLEFGKLLD